jgi:hypothetical protein
MLVCYCHLLFTRYHTALFVWYLFHDMLCVCKHNLTQRSLTLWQYAAHGISKSLEKQKFIDCVHSLLSSLQYTVLSARCHARVALIWGTRRTATDSGQESLSASSPTFITRPRSNILIERSWVVCSIGHPGDIALERGWPKNVTNCEPFERVKGA